MKSRPVVIVLAIAGAAALAITLWPKAPKPRVSQQGLRECLVAVRDIPSEHIANRGLNECLKIKREEERVARWKNFSKAVATRNQRCSDLGYWKPGSKLGGECPIPEPTKP